MTWMESYYANPTPERFASELRALAKDGSLDKPPTRIVVATFLGLVMRANPARISGWTTELGDLRGTARETLPMVVAVIEEEGEYTESHSIQRVAVMRGEVIVVVGKSSRPWKMINPSSVIRVERVDGEARFVDAGSPDASALL